MTKWRVGTHKPRVGVHKLIKANVEPGNACCCQTPVCGCYQVCAIAYTTNPTAISIACSSCGDAVGLAYFSFTDACPGDVHMLSMSLFRFFSICFGSGITFPFTLVNGGGWGLVYSSGDIRVYANSTYCGFGDCPAPPCCATDVSVPHERTDGHPCDAITFTPFPGGP